jgi:hypothetical protein
MPYMGTKKDNFEARCEAAEAGRYLPKFDDLLRCGPYFKDSLQEDIKEFTRLCLSKFNGYYVEHHRLEVILKRIHIQPNVVDLMNAIDLTERDDWPVDYCRFGTLVNRRFRYYLASMQDPEQMRWVALECLSRVAGGWINAETNDFMKSALGWATYIRHFDSVAHQNCSQMAVHIEGQERLTYILAFDRVPRERRR